MIGNSAAEGSPLYVTENIKWKTGAISESVPAPFEQSKLTTYEQLGLHSEFKEFLLRHIDSDYLVSSVLVSAEDNSVLLEGIEKYKQVDAELISELQQQMENFEQCISAGIDVKTSEALALCERQTSISFRATQATFLAAFQRRFACLRLVQLCIEHERKQALAAVPTKKPVEPESSATNQAQLMMLFGLKNAGIGLLKVFPMCYRALPVSAQSQLVQPIAVLCEHLCSMEDLELLPSCTLNVLDTSNACMLDFKTVAISASSGTPSNAFDGSQTTAWASAGGKLSVTLKTPQDVASVSIAWAPNNRSSVALTADVVVDVGAPKRVTLFVTTINSEGVLQPPKLVFCALPSEEFTVHNSWVHTFRVDMARVKLLQFVLSSKGCAENRCEHAKEYIKIYNLEVALSESSAARKVKTLPLLREVQEAFMPLVEFEPVAKAVYDAQLSIVRSSGSLSLLLTLINSIWQSKSEKVVQELSGAAFLKLLSAIHSADYKVRCTFNTLYSSAGTKVAAAPFTSTTCELFENATVVRCQNKFGCAFVPTVELGSNSHEWEITILDEIDGDESVFVGVASKSVAAELLLKSAESCLVRCYNGEIFQGKRCTVTPVDAIHKGDVCRFSYHAERKTLSLAINGKNQGVIADCLTAAMVPCVLFQKSKHSKAVKLGEVTLTTGLTTKRTPVSLDLREKPTLQDVATAESVLELLLSELRHLADAKLQELTMSENGALVHALCAEATLEVVLLVVSLLRTLKAAYRQSPSTTTQNMICSLLVVLDLQVQCINLSKTSLSDLGFPADANAAMQADVSCALSFDEVTRYKATNQGSGASSDKGQRGAALLRAAAQVLEDMMRDDDSPAAALAVTAYAHGLSFFLSSTEKKIECALEIFADITTMDAPYQSLVKPQRLQLLQMIIQHLKATGEVLRVVDLAATSAGGATQVACLLSMLLAVLVKLHSKMLVGNPSALHKAELAGRNSELSVEILSLLSTFQQQVFYAILSPSPHTNAPPRSAASLKKQQLHLAKELLLPYMIDLLKASKSLLTVVFGSSLSDAQQEGLLRGSLIGALLQPMVYSLSLPNLDLSVYKDVAPQLIHLLEQLSVQSSKSRSCITARRLINLIVPRTAEGAVQKASLGWRTVKASFEDSDSSFAISENGALYTSSTASNTCAMVTMKFGPAHKAAWEFLLESDSANDECSTFGAARMPLNSRCYSSSPDLWMRRAYNGYLYCQGQSTGQTMDKIKPGDIIRVEWDGKAGTLSFGLNGSEVEVGFSNITEEVFPACGSYRNGVGIRLLKVEVYDALDVHAASDDIGTVAAFARPTADIKWLVSEENNMSVRDATLLSPAQGKGGKSKQSVSRWVTTRGDKGALEGIHEWTFELSAANKSPFSVGVFSGGNPYVGDRLAGPCYKISSKTPKTCDIPGSNLRLDATAIAANSALAPPPLSTSTSSTTAAMLSIPSSPDLAADAVTAEARPATTAAMDGQDKEQMAELPLSRTYRYLPSVLALAWHSDGSLWHNGVKVADDYGSAVLPLAKGAAISMRVDRFERTVSFAVNGVSLGVAFGPVASGAKAFVQLPRTLDLLDPAAAKEIMAVFPAGSVFSSTQALRIKATGFCGSTVVPFSMSLQKVLTNVVGRVAALLIQGPAISKVEMALYPWFASNLMIGGLEDECAAEKAGISAQVEPLGSVSEAEVIQALTSYHSPDTPPRLRDAAEKLYNWMETIDPEPIFLRTALERSNSYKFPTCELPFIACLLKHSGIAAQAAQCVVSAHSERPFLPTNEMIALWQRVKQLRVYLRTQRQALRTNASSGPPIAQDRPAALAPTAVTPLSRRSSPRTVDADDPAGSRRTREDSRSSDGSSSSDSSSDDEADDLAEELGRIEFSSAGGLPAVLSVPETVPNTPQTPFAGTSNSDSAVGGEANLYFSDVIHWTTQPSTAVSSHSPEKYCTVLALGFDFANELVFIRFLQRSDELNSGMASVIASTLHVDDRIAVTVSDVYIESNDGTERKGCIRMDYSSVDVPALYRGLLAGTADLRFEFDCAGYSRAVLQLPTVAEIGPTLSALRECGPHKADLAPQAPESDASPEQFVTLSDAIKERALFLLKLTAASVALDASDYKAKTLLYNLTKRYSDNFPASGSNEDLSRWKAQERWKRVVEFLHVQSRLQKQPSGGISEITSAVDAYRPMRTPSMAKISSINSLTRINSNIKAESELDKQDTDSPVMAALQACAIFMISDAIPATPQELHTVLKVRQDRSECRIFGFQILLAALKIPAIQADPQCVCDLLTFVKSAIVVKLPKPVKGETVDRTLLSMVGKCHYLNSLEGCSARTLSRVQGAFVDLYGACFHLLGQYMGAWESRARRGCGDFALRVVETCNDDRLQKELKHLEAHLLLEPVQSLMQLWTLHFSTRDHQWLLHNNILSSLQKLSSVVLLEDAASTWRAVAERRASFLRAHGAFAAKAAWSIWSKDYVQLSLRTGKLTHRKVLLHLYSIPESDISAEQRAGLGFPATFAAALDSLSDAQIVYLYHKVLQFVVRKEVVKEAVQKAQAAKEAEAAVKKSKEMTDRLAVCGAFDPSFKGRQITLGECNFEASIGDDGGGTAVCVYTNVKYDVAAECIASGNYFEITVVTLGRKAIGVGLADRDNFSFTNYMPGWEPHSYGYHGDDGHKFGEGRTPGDWPLFETGDVIGCGFDVQNRSIFYTRNGSLLGTAFTGVREVNLWPIVGFSNRHRMKECVKINFGIDPFVYESPAISGHPAALQERARREAEAAAATATCADAGEKPAESLMATEGSEAERSDQVIVLGSIDEAVQICKTAEEFAAKDCLIKAQLRAAEAFTAELDALRSQADLVLRSILIQATQAGPGSSVGNTSVTTGTTDLSTHANQGAANRSVAVHGAAPAVPVLTKEVSLFGTPKFFTTADSVLLQETIALQMIHEFMLSAMYLNQFNDRTKTQGVAVGSKESLRSLDSTMVLRAPDEHLSATNPSTIVNAYEVAEALNKHLLLLATLFDTSKTIRDELATTKVIRCLFMVIEYLHLRNRNVAFTLLFKILPSMSPDAVEEAVLPEWTQLVQQFDARIQGSSYRKRVGKMPISLIQALQLSSCKAISACTLHEKLSNVHEDPLSQSTSSLSYGTGTKALELADCKLHLLQKLFEAALWTELVACGVTDALRNASSAVDKLLAAGRTDVESVDIEVVQVAVAACATLSGLGIARNGSRISTTNEEKGVLLLHSEPRQESKYVLDRNLRDLNTATHLVTAPATAIEPLISVVDVDLTDLSQPLLQQFFQLMEKLLRWFRSVPQVGTGSTSSATVQTLFRLTSVSALTLSQLLIHQSEVVNFVHDSSIISDLISIALRPSELQFLPSFKSVLHMWKTTQMRCLELPDAENVVVAAAAACVTEVHEETIPAPASQVDTINIEEARKLERDHTADELSTELGVEKRLCLLYLDFHMMNVPDARASIQRVKLLTGTDQFAEHLSFFSTAAAASEEKCVEDDANIFKKIGAFDPADLQVGAGAGTSRKTCSSDPCAQMSLLSVREYLRRRVSSDGADGAQADELVMLAQTELDGSHCAVMGALQYISSRALAGSLAESLLAVEADDGKSKTAVEKSSECFLLTQYVGMVTGILHTDLVDPFVHHKVVQKIFGSVALNQLTGFRTQLDCNLAVQSIRSVAAKLLLDGNLNLSQDASKQRHWTDLVKIVSTSESEPFEKVVPAMCGALLVPADHSSATSFDMACGSDAGQATATNAVTNLVEDVVTGLDQLCNLQLSSTERVKFDTSADHDTDMLEFASPHPFPAPSSTVGVIRIPEAWKNVALQFHPLCSTPSERAVLELFSSEEDMAARKPLLSLWGKPSRWEHAQNKCISGPINALCYKFTAAAGSNMKPVAMSRLDGDELLYQDGLYSVSASTGPDKVGMGEEDTLFNLFDDTPPMQTDRTTTAGCDMPYMTSGAWYYEATVMRDTEDLSSSIGIVSEQFGEEGFDMTAGSTNACYFDGHGVVVLMSYRHWSPSAEWGSWKRSDVLGCLFEVTTTHVNMWVSKNGTWSEKFTSVEKSCGWKPAVHLVGQFKLAMNWGEQTFRFSPPADVVEQLSEKSYQGVVFHSNADKTGEASTAPLSQNIADVWGYHFAVKPVMSLRMKLCTEFELTKKFVLDATDGASQKIWIWRPIVTAMPGYLPWGDICTCTEYAPRRSVVVDKAQCRPATSVSCVFFNSKIDLAVWRLVPPPGYVSLGDVVSSNSSSGSHLHAMFLCVPEWSVQECEVSQSLCHFKKCGSGKELTTSSIWAVDNGLGAFFGSPFEGRYSDASEGRAKCSRFEFYSVGTGYKLIADASLPNVLAGEWSTEKEVISAPSLSWTASLLRYLLDSPAVRAQVLTPEVFLKLLRFLRSSASPAPLTAVPLLIKMVRLAQKEKVKLPLDEVKTLSSGILTMATALKTQKPSLPLMKLVDFVIELQVAHVEESFENDTRHHDAGFITLEGCADCELLQSVHQQRMLDESKEEIEGAAAIECKEGEVKERERSYLLCARSACLPASPQTDWWERAEFTAEFVQVHRAMSPSIVKNIFIKDSTIVRLRQALKFINAISDSGGGRLGRKRRLYPRLVTSKIWNDYGSTTTTEESAHPYKSESFTRKIVFPGAEKLYVTFDQRCALAEGDKFTILSPSLQATDCNQNVEQLVLSCAVADLETVLTKGITITGDQLTVEFETSASEGCPVNPENLWGWSCVVFAAGSVYERADALVDISGALNKAVNIQDVVTANGDLSSEVTQKMAQYWTAGLTATQFAHTVLTDLYDPVQTTEESAATATEPAKRKLDDLSKELICQRGTLFKEGSISVPMSHTLRVSVDHMDMCDSAKEAADNLMVVEFTASYSTPSTHEANTADTVCRMHVAHECSHWEASIKGDQLRYRIYVLKKQDFLTLLEATPVPEFPTSASVVELPDAESGAASADAAATSVPAVALTEEVPGLEQAEDLLAVDDTDGEDLAAVLSTEEQMWACEMCTLLNAPHLAECSVCATSRPAGSAAAAARRAAPTAASPDAGSAAVGWWCSVCTFINPLSLSTCSMCGNPRDDGAEPGEADTGEEEAEGESAGEDEESHSSHSGGSSSSSEHVGDGEENSDSEDDRDGAAGEEHSASDARSDPDAGAPRKSKGMVGTLSGDNKTKLLTMSLTQETLLIVVEGKMTNVEKFEARVLGAMASKGAILTPAQTMQRLSEWTPEADIDLIDHLNNSAAAKFSSPYLFALPRKLLTYCHPLLSSKSLLDIQTRVQHVEMFNKHLEHLIPFIDLGNDDPHSLGALIRKSSRYLLLKIKTPLLNTAISSTTVTTGRDLPASLVLDNTKAFTSRDKAERDPANSQNCFVQAFQQLNNKDATAFRFVASSDRVFQTTFVGEAGIDAGGVYREGMTRIVEDLFSDHFNLLLLCPNAQQAVHSNMDKFVPNPHHSSSPLALSMFEFIGKLLAMSVRTKLCLPFEFPPIVWKKLVGEAVGLEDLVAIDAIACKQLEAVRCWDPDKMDPSRLRFEYIGSDKIDRELVPGGRDIPVTYESRLEFCEKLVSARLNEFNDAVAAMGRGMEAVIPGRALWLFSSSQLEELVCGSPAFDMELWRKQTETSGVSSSTVALFWTVMNTLSQKELSGFVRFAWGRSRLPAKKDFTTRMRLTSGGTATLPVSHTCFFSVELPEYRTEEAMRHGLLTAIHYGAGGILNG